jgi:hypothetical protein
VIERCNIRRSQASRLFGLARRASIFSDYRRLVYVMPCGVVVRAIAAHVNDKHTDPAVVVTDIGGRWAMSLLSGHEGVAMLSVDEHFQNENIRRDTLDLLNEGRGAVGASNALGFAKLEPDEIVCVYARGYWLTRFLRERHPDILRSFLTLERTAEEFDAELARLLGVPLHLLWIEVDRGLYRYFSG